jgi:phosphopantothenoylcysteine decarboxylase/phosphopantothenate--cysteine ligase
VNEIKCVKSRTLRNKTIVLGITGSVACYKSIDLARELIRRCANVIPVLTPEATKLITPELFEWATGNKALVEFSGETEHVWLSRSADAMVIAPITSNTISKIAYGISDTSVSLTALNFIGLKKPLIIAPAMHSVMWKSKPIQEAVKRLANYGVLTVDPDESEGKAKFPPIEDIVHAVEAAVLRGRDLSNLNILVTAGPTREYLDDIRFLTNASTGKMGISIAKNAFFRGAKVTLIHGPTNLRIPYYIESVEVVTVKDMLDTVLSKVKNRKYDAVILAAAPSDFCFANVFKGKITSDKGRMQVELVTTPKISLELRKEYKGLLVGFAAEIAGGNRDLLVKKAINKLETRGFDILIANDVSKKDIGFSSEYNEVYIIDKNGLVKYIPKSLKEDVAMQVLDIVRGAVTY